MIRKEIFHPQSIAIIGASNDRSKPGGKVLQNLLAHSYAGKIFPVNPKAKQIQGIDCYRSVEDLPTVELAIIAVAAFYMEAVLTILAHQKNCRAFIIFAAGFSETGAEGRELENRCARIIHNVGGTLIGPNCTGIITGSYKGVFAGPIPEYHPQGCDCVSASGATMVYLLETALPCGLRFRDLISVGNSAQVGIEDILEYWDDTFDPAGSSRIKLLYMEEIADPQKFLHHARSLVQKGCRIAAIKAGSTEAGSRAALSHTGVLADNDTAVNALFRKAGIIRCYSRVELVYVAGIFTIPPLRGNRLAVITHAGGPGIMLTDVLVRHGMQVPAIRASVARALLPKLHPGASATNPVDFLATGTAAQLSYILDAVEHDFDNIDGSVVVFGTTGLGRVDDVYAVLHEQMNRCKKPIFPILPASLQAAEELGNFHACGRVHFSDEVSFGYVLSRVYKSRSCYPPPILLPVAESRIRTIINSAGEGYLSAHNSFELLQAAGIEVVERRIVLTAAEVPAAAADLGFPLVMKAVGPIHKSDCGGVVLDISSQKQAVQVFEKLMKLTGTKAVLMQPQIKGLEFFLGAKKETRFGHLLLLGMGGIFVEVLKDIAASLAPLSRQEALAMIKHLKAYPVIKGLRGQKGIDESLLAESIIKLAALVRTAPEIADLDINPLIGYANRLIAVDARIFISNTGEGC